MISRSVLSTCFLAGYISWRFHLLKNIITFLTYVVRFFLFRQISKWIWNRDHLLNFSRLKFKKALRHGLCRLKINGIGRLELLLPHISQLFIGFSTKCSFSLHCVNFNLEEFDCNSIEPVRRMFHILISKVISVLRCHSAHNTEVTFETAWPKTGLYFKQDTTVHNVIWSQKTETKGGKHEA